LDPNCLGYISVNELAERFNKVERDVLKKLISDITKNKKRFELTPREKGRLNYEDFRELMMDF
jgi:Ca2+-binding EF-hand superfamily protein